MPAREIQPELVNLTLPKLGDLKRRWKVSMAALIRRSATLGTITARQQRSFFMRFSQLGYRKVEPVAIPQEEPSLIRQVIQVHQTEHGYNLSDLSEAALLLEEEFRDRYLTEESPQARLRLVR